MCPLPFPCSLAAHFIHLHTFPCRPSTCPLHPLLQAVLFWGIPGLPAHHGPSPGPHTEQVQSRSQGLPSWEVSPGQGSQGHKRPRPGVAKSRSDQQFSWGTWAAASGSVPVGVAGWHLSPPLCRACLCDNCYRGCGHWLGTQPGRASQDKEQAGSSPFQPSRNSQPNSGAAMRVFVTPRRWSGGADAGPPPHRPAQ